MKIHKDDIKAACAGYAGEMGGCNQAAMMIAIEAALIVRRARKQAKRERQRKEKDKQVQGSVGGIDMTPNPYWVNPAPIPEA